MIPAPHPHWSLVQGEMLVRAGGSLDSLVVPTSEFDAILGTLSAINPLGARPDHPWTQLHHCAACARDICADPKAGLSPTRVDLFMSAYETGLLAGFDRMSLFVLDEKNGEFRRNELEKIGAIGWRHGEALRQWWASYSGLVASLFGIGAT